MNILFQKQSFQLLKDFSSHSEEDGFKRITLKEQFIHLDEFLYMLVSFKLLGKNVLMKSLP